MANPKRHEARVPATLNVRVLGIDANGRPFHQSATTLDISLSGARINGLAAKLNPGDIVGLQSSGARSRFKVSWVRANRDDTFMLGLHCLEKGSSPWRDWLKIQQIRAGDRRSDERHRCTGSATLHSASSPTPIWGTLRTINVNGCYVQCVNAAEPGETLSGEFTVNGMQINAVVEVCNSVQAVGMGLQWCDLGCDGEEKLNAILRALAKNSADANPGREIALSKVNELQHLVSTLRERLEGAEAPVQAETIRELGKAEDSLTAAIEKLES